MIHVYKNNDELLDILDELLANEGNFIPKTIENVLRDGFSSPYYKNQFLAMQW